MSFQWEDYNTVSKHLIEMDTSIMVCDEQAYYRAAISRCYYAAFKTSQDWIEANPHTNYLQPTNQGTHEAVITHLDNHFGGQPNNGRSIKIKLASLKASRIKADYENNPSDPFNRQQAENLLLASGRIITTLKSNPVAVR